ncbi:hypothetical protein [Aphanizomenon flos-aquae]|uniref:hypothetical protein n=1 Tax=Aphanizomenon flos-aquae TaxID=1176 RepID=UPI0004B6DF33|nr:hypothetical protein [Aphanizomenon flos-aquae]
MTTRLEVESVIKQLPESEVRDLAKWIQEYLDEMWDRQIEADLGSGKLDRLIAQAEKDIAIAQNPFPCASLTIINCDLMGKR